MAIDPICGMTVDETSSLRAERDGKRFIFAANIAGKNFWRSQLWLFQRRKRLRCIRIISRKRNQWLVLNSNMERIL